MTLINVFTSTNQPLLMEDYTHLFNGTEPNHDDELTRHWKSFLKDLERVEVEIDKRNEGRVTKNINFSPRVLEGAVSK